LLSLLSHSLHRFFSTKAGSEAGTTAITVTAANVVTGNQTISLGVSGTNITAGDYTLSNSTIAIPSGQTTGSVTFTIVDDNLTEATETATLTISKPSSGIALGTTTTQDITITDNDPAGITVTPTTGLVTTEAGGTATFTVVLDSQPTADVIIPISSSNTAEGTASPASLTFTSANFNTPQTVTVTGVDDLTVDGNIAYNILTGAATSTDTNYSGVDATDVAVTNTDNDSAGVTIAQSGGSTNVTEGGATDSYTVVLNTQPTSDVTITLNTGTQLTSSPSTLNFTTANWNTAQTVTISAVDDTFVEGTHTGVIAHTIASTDPNYSTLTIPSITANITDNDSTPIPPTIPTPPTPPIIPTNQIIRVTTPDFTLRDPGSTDPTNINPTNAADGDYFNFTDRNDGTLTIPISLADLNIGDRTIRALSGDDVIVGTNAGDRVQANAGADHITGLAGDDLFWGGRGMDSLYGNAGNDTLYGGRQSDLLLGGQGNDLIYGGKGKDSLNGGKGNDTLSGDRGQDFLRGDDGADLFILRGGDFLASRPEDADIIMAFSLNGDLLGLEDGIAFGQLSFESVNLSIDSGSPSSATAIRDSSGNYLAILVGVRSTGLTSSLFASVNVD
jgi:Ca2+-binding RTX toxin-like protein